MAVKKYFFFSNEQLKMRREVESNMGKKFKPGQVTVNGVRKPFTEMTTSDKSRYPDAKLVAEGDPTTMVYTEPTGV